MLEQAIIDAEALREAATKNAETLVLEKYSNQIKEAVETLLEQEEPALDDAAVMGAEVSPVDDAAAAPAAEQSSVMEHIPLAVTSENSEQVEIPLDKLLEEVSLLNQELRFNGDIIEDPELFEHNIVEVDENSLMEMLDEDYLEEAFLDEELEEAYLDEDYLEEEFLDEDETVLETEPSMVDSEALEEQLTVDIHPVKRGWAGLPEGDIHLAEQELLALEQDTEVKEERDALRKAVAELSTVNETHEKVNTKLLNKANKSAELSQKLKEAVEQLQEKLDNVNLTNAKLLYQNKALESDSLNERQKQALVEAVSNAETIEEAKVIFETLQNTVGSTSRKQQPNSLSEAVQKSSSVILSARKHKPERQNSNPTLDRWKFLAGIDKQ
tara:strand:+ start:1223 stop:2374 length:1152 start_codon:yes stop_codon:yes gene_type:complete